MRHLENVGHDIIGTKHNLNFFRKSQVNIETNKIKTENNFMYFATLAGFLC